MRWFHNPLTGRSGASSADFRSRKRCTIPRLLKILFLAALAITARDARADAVPPASSKDDAIEWQWDDHPDVHEYVKRLDPKKLSVTLRPRQKSNRHFNITIKNSRGQELIAFPGHPASCFVANDELLFCALYFHLQAEVKIRAIEIETGRVVWEKLLIRRKSVMAFSSFVNLKLQGERLFVFCKQSDPPPQSVWLLNLPDGAIIKSNREPPKQ